jgi:hypothetical protein
MTPLWPRMKPKRKKTRMLKMLSDVGTKTPWKVPSLAFELCWPLAAFSLAPGAMSGSREQRS